jgi:RNA polymerase sigma-70 factor (ECF subfamily)
MKNLELDDRTLVRKHLGGDTRAFSVLVERHRDRVFRTAYRLTRNHDDAEDIAAEAFIRAHRGIHAFTGSANFSTWLYRIVMNCFLDTKRNPNKPRYVSLERYCPETGDEVEIQLPAVGPGPDEHAVRDAQRHRLLKALKELPPQYRLVIELYHGDMLSYEEMSEVLELPIGTVKSRLNRARLAARDLLKEDSELFLAAAVA